MKEEQEPNKKQLEILNDILDVPLPYQKRQCTDVCCLGIGLLFFIIIFILAAALFNYQNYYHANFPSDSDGRLCGIDQSTKMHPYIYFTNPPSMAKRVCVQQCPKPNSTKLNCVPTEEAGCQFTNKAGFQVINYENYQKQTRSGYFCYPQNQEFRYQLLINSNLQNRDEFYNSIDTIKLSFYVSLAFCVMYLLAVQFFAKFVNYVTVILGSLIVLASIICVITYHSNQIGVKVIVVLVLIVAFIMILISAFKNLHSWEMHSIFLAYSTKMIRQKPLSLVYIPLFILFLFGFIVIIVLEFTSFWTSGTLEYNSQTELFYHPRGGGPIVLTIILVIQAVWGFSFLKAAFNFCVSGLAIHWFYGSQFNLFYPFRLMLCKHLGSVIAGSFMTGFMSCIDFIFDTLKPNKHADPNTRYTNCYYKVCEPFVSIFDLVREDAIGFINLTANPYCNSSRYCEYLCGRSQITDYSQSISRIYRMSAHCLLTGTILVFSLYIKGTISLIALFIIGLITMFTSTLFISFHADISQAIQIVFLADEQFSRRVNENVDHKLNDLKVTHRELLSQIRAQLSHQRQAAAEKADKK